MKKYQHIEPNREEEAMTSQGILRKREALHNMNQPLIYRVCNMSHIWMEDVIADVSERGKE